MTKLRTILICSSIIISIIITGNLILYTQAQVQVQQTSIQKNFVFNKDITDSLDIKTYIDLQPLRYQTDNIPEIVIENWEDLSLTEQTTIRTLFTSHGWIEIPDIIVPP